MQHYVQYTTTKEINQILSVTNLLQFGTNNTKQKHLLQVTYNVTN